MTVTVIENGPGRLVVSSGPTWRWWTWFTRVAAVPVALLGLVFVIFVFERGSLTCDRTSGRCTAVHATLFGTERRDFDAAQLRGAFLKTETDTPDQARSAAMLQIGDDQFRLLTFDTPDAPEASDASSIVDEINRFVESPATARLDTGTSADILVSRVILVALVMGAAVWLAWSGRITTCTFDRTTGTYTLRRSVVIPLTRQGPLAAITKVEVQTRPSRRVGPRHFVRLLLSGDRRYTIDNSDRLAIAHGLQSTISRFLWWPGA
jgi:hypothetical protein